MDVNFLTSMSLGRTWAGFESSPTGSWVLGGEAMTPSDCRALSHLASEKQRRTLYTAKGTAAAVWIRNREALLSRSDRKWVG